MAKPVASTLRIQFVWLCLWASAIILMGCQTNTQNPDSSLLGSSRQSDAFVKGIMHHYTVISRLKSDPGYGSRVVGALTSDYHFTIGGSYKEDTFRILLPDLLQLNNLCIKTGLSPDSLLMTSLVKGEKLIEFDAGNIYGIEIVRKWKSVDSVKSKGKQYFLEYYFKENGFQKVIPTSDFEKAYIIDILSDWGVLVGLDDESGFYYLRDVVARKYKERVAKENRQ